jgi:hypothetical protein
MKYLILIFFSHFCYSAEYIVEFEKTPNLSNISSVLKVSRFDQYQSEYYDRLFSVTSSRAGSELEGELNKMGKIIKIEPVLEFATSMSIIPNKESISNDIYSTYQWALNNQGQSLLVDYDDITSMKVKGIPGFDLGLKNAKEKLAAIKNEVIVAVIDSGLDLGHPELKDRIYKNDIECLKGDLHFKPTVDNDKNGYIGDCMGWNFAAEKDGNHLTHDDVGHGTHVAGIIAALSDNNKGIAGAAQFVKILPIKVSKRTVEARPGASAENKMAAISISTKVAKAVLYAIKMKAKVINLSMGWPKALDLKYVREAFKEAKKNNIVIVAAAGNNNSYQTVYPCSYDEVICVGAITIDGTKASFSNWGGMVDIAAPGEQILSLFPSTQEPDFFSIRGYEVKNGTSQASPYVAAGAAIVKALLPESTSEEVRKILMSSTKKIDLGTQYWMNSGLLRYDYLVDLPIDPSLTVIPKIKQLDQVQLARDDQSFKIEVVLESSKLPDAHSEVSFTTMSKGVVLPDNVFKITHDEINSMPVSVNAAIDSLENENHFILDVNVKTFIGDTVVQRQFSKHVSLVRSLDNVDVIKKTLPLTAEEKKVIVLKNPLKTSYKINSVTDQYRTQNFVSYYFTQKLEGAYKLTLLSLKNEEVKKFQTTIPGAVDINLVQWLDLNLDGKADLWIRAMIEEVIDGQKVSLIRYYLFDNELKPLIADLPYVNFRPELKVANIREIFFLPQNTPFGRILLPVICGDGYLPKFDREKNLLLNTDTQVQKRIYYYTLGKDKELTSRSLDTNRFYQNLKNKFKLRFNELPNLMFFRPQSKDQLSSGKIEALFDMSGILWVLTIGEDLKYEMTPTKTASFYVQSQNLNNLVDTKNNQINYNQTGIWGHLQNDYLAQWHVLDDITGNNADFSTVTYKHPRARDNIVDMMTSFKVESQNHIYFQTKGSIVLVRQNSDGKDETFSHLIHRNSFIPGSIFTEIYYPVVSREFKPAFYVDASQLYAGHLYLIKEKKEGLSIPTRYSMVLPSDCQAMNPQRVNGLESMSVLCESNGELQLNFLPF